MDKEILKNQRINIKPTRRLERTALDLAQPENAMKATRAIKKHSHTCWQKHWETYISEIPEDRRTPAQKQTLGKNNKLHTGLTKQESSLITQIRTEKIGLAAFLARQRVPRYTLQCTCLWPRQDPKHIIMNCPIQEAGR